MSRRALRPKARHELTLNGEPLRAHAAHEVTGDFFLSCLVLQLSSLVKFLLKQPNKSKERSRWVSKGIYAQTKPLLQACRMDFTLEKIKGGLGGRLRQ